MFVNQTSAVTLEPGFILKEDPLGFPVGVYISKND